MTMEQLYTVVTIYSYGDTKLVHSYGPFTRDQAVHRRRKIQKMKQGKGTLTAHVTKVLDPENHTPFIWGKVREPRNA